MKKGDMIEKAIAEQKRTIIGLFTNLDVRKMAKLWPSLPVARAVEEYRNHERSKENGKGTS